MNEPNTLPPTEFRDWALVELMGHQKIAGLVSTQSIAGPMLRVDVPDKNGETKYTRFYAPAAIYGISPVEKRIAIAMAQRLEPEPVSAYMVEDLLGEPDQLPAPGEACGDEQHADPDD